MAACIVSFDWARAQSQMSAFDCVYCVTVTNSIMNVKIIVWVPVVPVVPLHFSVTTMYTTTSDCSQRLIGGRCKMRGAGNRQRVKWVRVGN